MFSKFIQILNKLDEITDPEEVIFRENNKSIEIFTSHEFDPVDDYSTSYLVLTKRGRNNDISVGISISFKRISLTEFYYYIPYYKLRPKHRSTVFLDSIELTKDELYEKVNKIFNLRDFNFVTKHESEIMELLDNIRLRII